MLSPRAKAWAKALRMSLTQSHKRPAQFAFVSFGIQDPAQPPPQTLHALQRIGYQSDRRPQVEDVMSALNESKVEPGGLLAARVHELSFQRGNDMWHSEAMLLDRLRAEPAGRLKQLQPLVFFSFKCPCPMCAARFSDFRYEHRDLSVEVAYERPCVPEEYARFRSGCSDESSVRWMREAGVGIGRVEPPSRAARRPTATARATTDRDRESAREPQPCT